jgi:TRAP transporter 4TM/12TM fusion protein
MPYAEIIIYAIVPAILYYLIIFMSVHFEAIRLDLQPVARFAGSTVKGYLKEGWTYLVTLTVLLYCLLVKKYPPEMSATYAIIAMIALSFLLPDKEKRLTFPRIWQALIETTKAWLLLAAVTGAVGMLIGSLQLSGLGVKFSGFILSLTSGNLLATLILVGIACFIMGMGLDSITSYMTLAILIAPALIELGVSPIIAHLYIIYWAMSSFITPPVCLSVYAACGISGSRLWETGWESVKIGIGVFIVPFTFVYNPDIMLHGATLDTIAAVITALIGTVLVAASMRGMFIRKIPAWARIVLFIAAISFISKTSILTVSIGCVLTVIALFTQFSQSKEPAQV